ncbi:hypothetical protein Mgra_00004183 [Meloidogyne graminicola]|uniref:Uncharacterized protein n=1 Tax=Meloidogyne graminicola TaxID=189291 RepID=A0A8S9ZSD2_9BILA|nr:hypothetical protein Mgra_00004183 [Meloidogyne graminicola]
MLQLYKIYFYLNKFNLINYRYVSNYHVRPNPRPYKRRVYEAALAPIIPNELEQEWKQLKNPYNIYATSSPHKEFFNENEFSLYELALIEKVSNWIKTEEFKVMAICHTNFVKEEVIWFAKNKFRLEGIELIDYPKNIANLFNQCSQYNWIFPIVVKFNEEILSLEQTKEIAEYKTLENAQIQTTLILNNFINQFSNSLNNIICQFPQLLNAHLEEKNKEKEEEGGRKYFLL